MVMKILLRGVDTMRKHNFNAGPAALPLAALERAAAELVDFHGIGMSIMEVSHRSSDYEGVHNQAQQLLRELLHIPDNYKILLLQGGASLQFAMLPMNFLSAEQVACYVQTGNWSNKALKEAKLIGKTQIVASSDATPRCIPDLTHLTLPSNAAYVHVTSNETIEGLRMNHFPETGDVPLMSDMSSDILSRPFDVSRFGLIYAGAQKNLGPSGVTVVIIRDDLLERIPATLPSMLRYDTHAKGNSLYNTPPTFSVYMTGLVLEWVKAQGGLEGMYDRNVRKAGFIYDAIDGSQGFYEGVVATADRSIMNITFGMKTTELEAEFLNEAKGQGFVGLKGHREVGHLRASAYNAVPEETCQALADFMRDFQRRH